MGLVDSGVDLIYIRDLLGHVSLTSMEVNAKADAAKKGRRLKRQAKKSCLQKMLYGMLIQV